MGKQGTWMPQHSCRCQRANCQSPSLFHCVGPRDRTQVLRVGSEHIYLPGHLTSPGFSYFNLFKLSLKLRVSSCRFHTYISLNFILTSSLTPLLPAPFLFIPFSQVVLTLLLYHICSMFCSTGFFFFHLSKSQKVKEPEGWLRGQELSPLLRAHRQL